MKREFRVKKHSDFQRIIQCGKVVKSNHFVCHYLHAERDFSKIGIAVGKSNGGAVIRVKIKRQVRAMIAKWGKYTLPLDLIIVVRPKYQIECFDEEERELIDLLRLIEESNIEKAQ